LLDSELAFAENISARIRSTGSPGQLYAANAGCCQLRDRAAQVELLGHPAPEIDVADWVLGQPTTLADQRGMVVLIEFWARSCRSCLAMFPALRDLHDRYHERGLTTLALTHYGSASSATGADRARERDLISEVVADQSLEIAVGIAQDGRLHQRYGATGVPTFAIIDRAGIVRLASSTPDKTKIEEVIASLLNDSFMGES
jgi:peroxiredoxin